MRKEKNKETDVTAQQQAHLKTKVLDVVAEMQNDVVHTRQLGSSKHLWEGACDEVYDEVESVLADIVKGNNPLHEDEDACGIVSEIAWAAVTFLYKTAWERYELDVILEKKCAELMNGSAFGRWKTKRRTRQRTP